VIYLYLLTVLSIVGTILNIKKRRSGFILWALTNFIWMIVDFRAGLPAQGVLFGVYCVLALWGLWAWRRRGLPSAASAQEGPLSYPSEKGDRGL
jgi:nicotinamide riboside transporter PnuC